VIGFCKEPNKLMVAGAGLEPATFIIVNI